MSLTIVRQPRRDVWSASTSLSLYSCRSAAALNRPSKDGLCSEPANPARARGARALPEGIMAQLEHRFWGAVPTAWIGARCPDTPAFTAGRGSARRLLYKLSNCPFKKPAAFCSHPHVEP